MMLDTRIHGSCSAEGAKADGIRGKVDAVHVPEGIVAVQTRLVYTRVSGDAIQDSTLPPLAPAARPLNLSTADGHAEELVKISTSDTSLQEDSRCGGLHR